jgi:hypothetical protein
MIGPLIFALVLLVWLLAKAPQTFFSLGQLGGTRLRQIQFCCESEIRFSFACCGADTTSSVRAFQRRTARCLGHLLTDEQPSSSDTSLSLRRHVPLKEPTSTGVVNGGSRSRW